jgi:metal-responsive CopG/Arc/MetJ family transcriptional regulator
MVERKMIHLQLEQDLLNKLDDFRFQNRLENRTEAIRFLLDWALKQNPKVQK